MYGTVEHSGGRARTFGIVTAAPCMVTVGCRLGLLDRAWRTLLHSPRCKKKMEVFILQPEESLQRSSRPSLRRSRR